MKNLMNFLRESNAVEDVWDELSLTYARAAWDYLIKQKKLTAKNILKTHAILMHEKLDEKNLGHFRTQQVWVGNREGIRWEKLLIAMEEWIEDAMTSVEVPGKNGEHIKLDHIQFELIHPFIDGNGRMGRILMNWQRVKAGLDIFVVKEIEKSYYYQWFTS